MHLLEGMPAEWLGPGMVTRLNGIAMPVGPMHLTVKVKASGKAATLQVKYHQAKRADDTLDFRRFNLQHHYHST